MLIKLASGSLPDVFQWWNGPRAKALFDAKVFLDLTDLVKQYPDNQKLFYKDAFDGAMQDGHVYGIPAEYVYMNFLVNRQLYQKYGLDLPKTYADVKNDVSVFNKNGIVPIAVNGTPPNDLSAPYDLILKNLTTTADFTASVNAKSSLAPGFQKAAEYMKELISMNAFPKGFLTLTRQQAVELYDSQKAATYINGSFMIGRFSKEIQANSVVIPFPTFPESAPDAAQRMIGFPAMAIWANAALGTSGNAAKKKAAEDLIMKMTNATVSRAFLEQLADFTPYNITYDASKVPAPLNDILKLRTSMMSFRPRMSAALTNAADSDFFNGLEALSAGTMSPAEFAQNLSSTIQKYQK
jgi:raffinose/stachyose/melibiose transport system substrate-binding protein